MKSTELQLSNIINIGMILVNHHQKIIFWNRWMEKYSGLTSDQVLDRSLGDVFDNILDQRIPYAINEAIHFGMASILSHTLHPTPLPLYLPEDTKEKRIKQSIEVIPFDSDNEEQHCLIIVRDVTDLVKREEHLRKQTQQYQLDLQRLTQTQEDLRKSEVRFRELTRHAPVGLFELDVNDNWQFLNEKCLEILGLDTANLINNPWLQCLPDSERFEIATKWHATKETSLRFNAEFMYCKPDRRIIWLQMEARANRDSAGKIVGFIGTMQDISEQREHLQRIEHRANYDSLTLMYNRNYFELKCRSNIAGAREINQKLGVLFIDLNKFKNINDEYGHAAGDKLLKTVATRIRRALREGDIAGRLGGDEFAIIINDISSDMALPTVIAKIRRAVSLPVNIGNMYIKANCAIGSAIFPTHGDNLEELIAHADSIMYQDKQQKA